MLTVAVVGAGLMGRGIAEVFAGAGHPVRLHDLDAATLHSAVDSLRNTEGAVDGSTDLAEAVAGAGLVVEAVAENLAAEQDLFAELDRLLRCLVDRAIALARDLDLPLAGVEETEQLLGLPDRKT